MANITTSQQASDYLDLLNKLKKIESSTVSMFVDLRNKEIHFAQTREFATSVPDAIITLEKWLYIWIMEIDLTYKAVDALNLSFSPTELVGF
jgi:hypothetical protein